MKNQSGLISFIIIVALLFASMVSLTDELNAIALYGAIPLAFILSFSREKKLVVNSYFRISQLM